MDKKEFNINGFKVVNEEKLNALKDEDVNELVKSGAYRVAIALLLSQNNFDKLMAYYE